MFNIKRICIGSDLELNNEKHLLNEDRGIIFSKLCALVE